MQSFHRDINVNLLPGALWVWGCGCINLPLQKTKKRKEMRNKKSWTWTETTPSDASQFPFSGKRGVSFCGLDQVVIYKHSAEFQWAVYENNKEHCSNSVFDHDTSYVLG